MDFTISALAVVLYVEAGRLHFLAALSTHPVPADQQLWSTTAELTIAARAARTIALLAWLVAWPAFIAAGQILAATARR